MAAIQTPQTSRISSLREFLRNHRTNIYWSFLFILILFHAVNNYIWISKDSNSLGCDVVHHTNIAIIKYHQLGELFFSQGGLIDKLRALISILSFTDALVWPPLTTNIAAFMSLIGKNILFCIRFSNIIYLIPLLISVYLTGKKLCNPEAGILSALLVSFYPGLFGLSRKFGIDYPSVAFVSVVMCLLVYRRFESRWWSLFLGIALGLAGLFNGRSVLFIGVPILYVIAIGCFQAQNKMKYIVNAVISVCIGLMISMIWWHRLFSELGSQTFHSYFGGDLPGYLKYLTQYSILDAFWHYLKAIYYNISPIFLILFFIGFFCYLKFLRKIEFFVVFLFLLVPYVILSLLLPSANKVFWARHLFPCFGAIAIISVVGLLKYPFKRYDRLGAVVFFTLVIGFGIFQFFHISYGWGTDDRLWFNLPKVLFHAPGRGSRYEIWFHAPDRDNHYEVIERFHQIIETNSIGKRNIAIIEHKDFKADSAKRLGWYLKVLDKQNEFFLSSGGVDPSRVNIDFLSDVEKYDFVVAFSNSWDKPNFSSLLEFPGPVPKSVAQRIIDRFEEYIIVQEGILSPQGMHIFLLSKKPSE